ncbi:Zinc finger HIT domain-containing protein 3 [Eumeta japonica]|uniref:Zinc finger HIT domain-containing protein 3 n=1 Tax=Eumeta variegata TaxID=151549 RepID=A0A4C1Y678_EUMVA|nr:Zinc finger HIT domain-containing protein 3 [Eumeta japonica]
MDCFECGDVSKYKCPTCRMPYCSMVCCKKHKEKPCKIIQQPEEIKDNEQKKSSYEFPTEDTVSMAKLKCLEHSKQLKQYLENPHLRKILEELDKSPYPDPLIQEFMQEPIFTEFVDECLKVVEPKDEDR